jgi:hypothetical protein
MAKMIFDEDGLLCEPCLSCDKPYVENVWNEWRCDEKECPHNCNFCSTIYPEDDIKNIVFRKGKYSGVHIDNFITIDNEGKYHVNIVPGDPYELGCLCDIKFCPYCGRKLEESEG